MGGINADHFSKAGARCAFMAVYLAHVASAQTPAPAAQAGSAEVWKRVGKFCDIGEWLRLPCTITSGKDGEFGTVRSGRGPGGENRTFLNRSALQSLSRDARGKAMDRDYVEAGLAAILRS